MTYSRYFCQNCVLLKNLIPIRINRGFFYQFLVSRDSLVIYRVFKITRINQDRSKSIIRVFDVVKMRFRPFLDNHSLILCKFIDVVYIFQVLLTFHISMSVIYTSTHVGAV